MKKLSKVICLVLSALMLLSLAACGKQAGGADDAQGKPIEGGEECVDIHTEQDRGQSV